MNIPAGIGMANDLYKLYKWIKKLWKKNKKKGWGRSKIIDRIQMITGASINQIQSAID